MTPYRFDIRIRHNRRTLVEIEAFHLPKGKVTFLLGESGIGKSLSAKALFGLLETEEFDARIDGQPYADHRRSPLAERFLREGFFVFQEPSTHLNPLMRLEDQISEGSLAGAPARAAILAQLWQESRPGEIQSLLEVYPKANRPSGGEKQRILCAMAFLKMELAARHGAADPLFVFDEPTGNLDNRYRDIVLEEILRHFRQFRPTVLLITHDYSMISWVTRQHGDILESINFTELSLEEGRGKLREFQPRTYLGWLSSRQPVRSGREAPEGHATILRVESGISVYGRTLGFSRTPGGEGCPLALRRSSMAYLKAPSGTGKTTIVKIMMGLVRGRNLRMQLGSGILSEATPRRLWQERIWGKRMTMVFQHADEALNLRSRVREVFEGLPLPESRTAEAIGAELLQFFGGSIPRGFLDQEVGTLSGGQKQRLNLLRSLLLDADVLILDEPLNGLDFTSMQRVLELLERKVKEGRALLLISHNEEIFDALVAPENIYYLSASFPE